MIKIFWILLLALGDMLFNTSFASDSLITTQTFFSIRYEMLIFGIMLVGIAIFYNKTMHVAVLGMLALCFYKYEFVEGFSVIKTLFGFHTATGDYVAGSWNTYLNLALMLPGFSLLANIFENSKAPTLIPKFLPNSAIGSFVLLICEFQRSLN